MSRPPSTYFIKEVDKAHALGAQQRRAAVLNLAQIAHGPDDFKHLVDVLDLGSELRTLSEERHGCRP